MDTKKTFGTNLYIFRKRKGLTITEIAKTLGTTKSTVSYWENGKSQPTATMLSKLCDLLGVNAAQLYTPFLWDTEKEYLPTPQTDVPAGFEPISKKKIPVLGNVACGEPIFADESLEYYAEVSNTLNVDFALVAKGDSMIDARIYDGDLVFIKKQDMVENGEIAAVLIGDEATLKRVYYDQQKAILTLMPANTKYQPFVYKNEELNQIKIIGKAVAFQSLVK